ncbi:MAG: bifunctional alpha,alpha-trehalose-phosphate synthase (UDP-forming)/trehalose-phosphatase [Thermoplasmatota archaeon]
MKRIIIASNRLPVNIGRKGADLDFSPSIGGLATALRSFYRDYNSVWVGWPGVNIDECTSEELDGIYHGLKEHRCRAVRLSRSDLEGYYEGFANNTIWPLFHYFIQYTKMDRNDWEVYKKVNKAFADEILKIAGEDDILWVHDYHLFLVPEMVREKLPDIQIGFFLHIPFPSSEVFRLLPWREEILKGIMGSDLVGFHTYDYVLHFISSVRRLLGYESSLGKITAGPRYVKVNAFPISIDYYYFSRSSENEAVQKQMEEIRLRLGDRKIIMSIDRLDYTKGIPQRIRAYSLFLEKHPEYHEKVTLIMVASPSREKVDTYQDLKHEVEQLVGMVNGRYTSMGWVPIWYIFQKISQDQLLALYNIADVALINPLRDGMNLIAKEYIACRNDNTGVLVLSELAGASKELGEGLLVNPNNTEEVAESIFEALEMEIEKQKRGNMVMRERIREYDVDRWAGDFINDLSEVRKLHNKRGAKRFDQAIRKRLRSNYGSASRRLILLDYDGTLKEFQSTPEEAKPDDVILKVLDQLSRAVGNELVIVSGRDRETLEDWFGELDIGIVGEHGVWIRPRGENWRMIEAMDDKWKETIRPVLRSYVVKTPRTFIEEKSFSLAWHYRMADQNQAMAQLSEMKETLHNMTSNLNVGVLDGNKVIEVKNTGINKGRGVKVWLARDEWDFILAIGDDWTDEDMFEAVGDNGCTIRVGFSNSLAKYHIKSVGEVRRVLASFLNS